MTRSRFIQCRETGELVEVDWDAPRRAPRDPSLPPLPAYHADISPYRSPITGETINSNSQRRAEMKEHNCVDQREVGRQVARRPAAEPGDYIRKGG